MYSKFIFIRTEKGKAKCFLQNMLHNRAANSTVHLHFVCRNLSEKERVALFIFMQKSYVWQHVHTESSTVVVCIGTENSFGSRRFLVSCGQEQASIQ